MKCECDKYYHLSCAYRIGECPVCSTGYSKKFLKQKMIEEKGFEQELRDVMEQEKGSEHPEELPKKELLVILKKRMVKGEIDLETYREMKEELER